MRLPINMKGLSLMLRAAKPTTHKALLQWRTDVSAVAFVCEVCAPEAFDRREFMKDCGI